MPILTVKVIDSGPSCHSNVKSPLWNTFAFIVGDGAAGSGATGDISAGAGSGDVEAAEGPAAETLNDTPGEVPCDTCGMMRPMQSNNPTNGTAHCLSKGQTCVHFQALGSHSGISATI